jgi:hypothetical protein
MKSRRYYWTCSEQDIEDSTSNVVEPQSKELQFARHCICNLIACDMEMINVFKKFSGSGPTECAEQFAWCLNPKPKSRMKEPNIMCTYKRIMCSLLSVLYVTVTYCSMNDVSLASASARRYKRATRELRDDSYMLSIKSRVICLNSPIALDWKAPGLHNTQVTLKFTV